MGLLSLLFQKNKQPDTQEIKEKKDPEMVVSLEPLPDPTAAVFVDFEHWCFSLNRLYGLKPQIDDFIKAVSKEYDVKRILFIGNFADPTLRSHIDDIRKYTNNIIDTQNTSDNIIKDFTDFIMLDYIYQDVDQFPETKTYIIFSGDGHFSSVATYLKMRKKKKVIVYGVSKATSYRLKSVADVCEEVPTPMQERFRYYKMIIDNLDYVYSQPSIKYVTFKTTVQAIQKKHLVDESTVTAALQELLQKRIVRKEIIHRTNAKTVAVLKVDWDLAAQYGLWENK